MPTPCTVMDACDAPRLSKFLVPALATTSRTPCSRPATTHQVKNQSTLVWSEPQQHDGASIRAAWLACDQDHQVAFLLLIPVCLPARPWHWPTRLARPPPATPRRSGSPDNNTKGHTIFDMRNSALFRLQTYVIALVVLGRMCPSLRYPPTCMHIKCFSTDGQKHRNSRCPSCCCAAVLTAPGNTCT